MILVLVCAFHMRCISVVMFLCFKAFPASFLTRFCLLKFQCLLIDVYYYYYYYYCYYYYYYYYYYSCNLNLFSLPRSCTDYIYIRLL